MSMSVGASVELYVYYKVPLALAAQAGAEVPAMRARVLQACPGVQSRWLRRTEIRDEMLTWMEIHTHPDGLDPVAVERICATLIDWPSVHVGPRHAEIFAALPVSPA